MMKAIRGEDMKLRWKAAMAALMLISSLVLAQDTPPPQDATPVPANAASNKAPYEKPAAIASPTQAGAEYVIGPEDVLHVAVW